MYLTLQLGQDYGSPRKDFFRIILQEIREKYFDNGLWDLLAEYYITVGTIMGNKMLSFSFFVLEPSVLTVLTKYSIYVY